MADFLKAREVLQSHLPLIEDDTLEYFEGIISDPDTGGDLEAIKESLAPLLEANGFADGLEAAEELCVQICTELNSQGIRQIEVGGGKGHGGNDTVLLEKTMNLGATRVSEKEQAAIDSMWGFDKIRSKKNDTIETTDPGTLARAHGHK